MWRRVVDTPLSEEPCPGYQRQAEDRWEAEGLVLEEDSIREAAEPQSFSP